jgi:fatty-acyl-CoA synthase
MRTSMMQKQDVEVELIAIVTEVLTESGVPYRREIKMDASLQRHLGIDSLGRAELFRRVEKTFSVTVPDRLLAEAETLGDIAKFLATAQSSLTKPARKTVITSHGTHPRLDVSGVDTLVDLLLIYGEKSPQKPHVFFQKEDGQEEVVTYGRVLESALRVATGLRERGLKPTETVAIMLPTTPDFFYAFYGVLLAGGVPVPIYPPFRMHMLEAYAKTEARILRNAEVRMLITFDEAENLSRLLQGFVPSLKEVMTVPRLMHHQALTSPILAKADDHAFIQYTSGSTNDPKGVLLTHQNLISNISAYGKAIQVNETDVAVSWLPLYHDFGLIGSWLGSLYHGVPLILMTPFSFLNHPARWLWAIHYHRGSLTGAPNFAYELCVRKVEHGQLEGLDLSSWRVAANGAEKVYPKTLEAFAKKFERYGFKAESLMPVYGLAESTVGLAIPPLNRGFHIDTVDRKAFEEDRKAVPSTDSKNTLEFAGCGMAIEGHAMRIVDDAGQVLPERSVGNVQFKGPSNMKGYYNNPAATAAIYNDGWLSAGDMGYLVDGEIFITGRRKDLIIKAGRNLYPAEIEELVGNVPGIRQGCVAAFGHTDPVRGTEQLVVVAETREKNRAVRETMLQNINEAIATTLDIVPDDVVLALPRSVPKTSSGKLQRAACKTMYLEGRLGRFQVPAWMQVVRLGAEWLGRRVLNGLAKIARVIYTTLVFIAVFIAFIPLYFVVRFSSSSTAARVVKWWARQMLRVACIPLTVRGGEHLTQHSPMIYVANHASYLDAVIAIAISPPGTRFVGKKELFNVPILRTIVKKLQFIPVDRKDTMRGLDDTKFMETVVREGHSIFIFPEGTFGYAAGLRPFRLGAFKVAAETGTPVCPVAIKGARLILREENRILRPGQLNITVSSPIKADGNEWQAVTQLRQVARQAIAENCGEPSLDFIAAQSIAVRVRD